MFGGPDTFSRTMVFQVLIDAHRGLNITDEQRLQFVDLYLRAADAADRRREVPAPSLLFAEGGSEKACPGRGDAGRGVLDEILVQRHLTDSVGQVKGEGAVADHRSGMAPDRSTRQIGVRKPPWSWRSPG